LSVWIITECGDLSEVETEEMEMAAVMVKMVEATEMAAVTVKMAAVIVKAAAMTVKIATAVADSISKGTLVRK
jgi:hypothetical protein